MRVPTRLCRTARAAAILLALAGWSPVQVQTAQPSGQAFDEASVSQLPLTGRNYTFINTRSGSAVLGPSGITGLGQFSYLDQTFPLNSIAADENNNLALAGQDGILLLDTLRGTKRLLSTIVGRPTAISYAGGGSFNVGVRTTAAGQSVIYTCPSSGVCTLNPTAPLSQKPYDSIKKLTVVPNVGTYAVGTNWVLFARDNLSFVNHTPNTLAGPYNDAVCNPSNYCLFPAKGGLWGGPAGQPPVQITNGFLPNTSGFTGGNWNSSGGMVVADVNQNAQYAQAYLLSGTDPTKGSWTLTPQLEFGYVKYSGRITVDPTGNFDILTNWGIYQYLGGQFKNLPSFPNYPEVTALASDNGLLRAGGRGTDPPYATFNGSYWQAPSLNNTEVRGILPASPYDFLWGGDGVFRINVPNGSPMSLPGLPVGPRLCSAAYNTQIGAVFAGDSGVYKTNPGFTTVSQFTDGLTNLTTDPVRAVTSCGNSIVAAQSSALSWTTGSNWSPFGPPLPNGVNPSALRCKDPMTGQVEFGTRSGDFYQGGASGWTKQGNIAPAASANQLLRLDLAYNFARAGRETETATPSAAEFAATSKGLYGSVDGGATWFAVDRSLGTSPVLALAADATHLYVGTTSHGLVVYALPLQYQRLVPIVLDVDTGTAHYTSEVAVTNRNTTTATVTFQYTASLGSGSGTVTDTVAPGLQFVIPDVMAYLRQKGLAIPAGGSQAGTLLLTFGGITDGDAVAVTVRTTAATAPPLPVGRTGLAYSAIDPASGTDGSLYLYGLRSTGTDRANVAVFNTSATPVSVRVTAFSGAGDGHSQVIVASDPLPAWGWKQYNRVLDGTGFTNGWVRIDRVSGARTYFSAYAVINDNVTNDGSFVLPAGATPFLPYANVPVVVETPAFSSEFVLANSGSATATFTLSYRESLGGTQRGTATVTLPPGTQLIQPNAIAWLRSLGIPIGPAGAASYAGSVHVEVDGVTADQTYAGARTASNAAGGGEFGLFSPAFTPGTEGEVEGWIYGLRADAGNRSNVAVSNTGGTNDGTITLSIQAYDGDKGGVAAGPPAVVTLGPGQWQQLNDLLRPLGVANGWVKVTRTAGIANWIAYGVVNDGGQPGQGTGDGAYVPMSR
jgi:hypothetical protein